MADKLNQADARDISLPENCDAASTDIRCYQTPLMPGICYQTPLMPGMTSQMPFSTNLSMMNIADSRPESTDISSSFLAPDVDREITMEDFLELEEFLDLGDGESLKIGYR
ncbi:hypothetical protein F2Q70_00042451 [Brassica cretica]|uniref:Uncharacterized protein n=1 Tax=Brassica cretica TaxID=69181 RepID=A0A8S9KKP1_BRACR|nr:hypothetical protein F2Q70_00042451 [Brassica cretica]KAF2607011.1 hypothetical protein F2Q68_00043228 [Brassica cretica]